MYNILQHIDFTINFYLDICVVLLYNTTNKKINSLNFPQGGYTHGVTLMQYFKNISTIEQLRKSYNTLAKQYHPDINHSPDAVRIMQDINAEYAAAFKWLQNHDSEHLNCYDKIDPAAYPEIISKIIGLTELTIEICGSWVWLTGKTWLYAEQLKAAGFKFRQIVFYRLFKLERHVN